MFRRKPTRRRISTGFTIIEVILVLAIAGLILLIVLLTVPALRRNERNVARKNYTVLISTYLSEYKADHDHYPMTAAEGADFIATYIDARRFTVAFHDSLGPHSYVPPADTIAIEYGHWCNRYGDGDNASDPIAGDDIDLEQFAIWTSLESAGADYTFCVDNHGK